VLQAQQPINFAKLPDLLLLATNEEACRMPVNFAKLAELPRKPQRSH